MNSSRLFVGIIAGIIAGAAFGYLSKTRHGEKVRRTLSKKKNEYAQEVKNSFAVFLDAVSDKYDTLADGISGYSESGRNAEQQILF